MRQRLLRADAQAPHDVGDVNVGVVKVHGAAPPEAAWLDESSGNRETVQNEVQRRLMTAADPG